MIITCEQCQARFRMADEKLKAEGTKVRCSKCKHVFTVMPPEADDVETVDFGDFNMERVDEEEAAAPPAQEPDPQPVVPTPAATGSDAGELDFSGLEESMGPADANQELAEDFSFADTSRPATPAAEKADGPITPSGELDFDATFAESDDAAATVPEPGAPAFPAEASDPFETPGDTVEFGFEEPAAADEPFAFAAAPPGEEPADAGSGPGEFDFGDGEQSEPLSFGGGESPAESLFPAEPAFGETETAAWETPAGDGLSFDFEEPDFGEEAAPPAPARVEEGELKFGEIDFADDSGGDTPGFGAEPDFSQASLARPAEPEMPPPPPSPPPRPTSSRPHHEEPLPPAATPRKSPVGKVLGVLFLLLLILAGAGGYFYFMGNGQKTVNDLLRQFKGELPPGPVEQKIGLVISGSSYVNNREAGQLLVIQGQATNNFPGARSAITVKGLVLDAGGKVLQQQTVFCGNYLSEEKLATARYAQIEEAMNNQFGDSLSNMNVKPGSALRFTIVFRNVSKDLANINVEVVDSKPGGL